MVTGALEDFDKPPPVSAAAAPAASDVAPAQPEVRNQQGWTNRSKTWLSTGQEIPEMWFPN